MKKITFKTLSILLAAVLLVAALPVTAFAEDVSPCAALACEHLNTRTAYEYFYDYISNDEHYVHEYRLEVCLDCRESNSRWVDSWEEQHTIDLSVDQEYEMEGPCIDCGETIYW
jgi:hypothetical protein